RTAFPECHITWAVRPGFADLVERCEAVDHVERVFAKGSHLFDELRRIRRWEPFDIAIDAQGLTKSAVVVGSVRAKQKVGYHWQREIAPFF
ncbi:glycosyltransferase family 9 protein, partial [Acinetobacter baumannii]